MPWAVRVDLANPDASLVWASTRDECWFDAPRSPSTSWTCPATATGDAQILVTVTENGVATPHARSVSLTVPYVKQTMSATASLSTSRIRVGQSATVTGTFMAMATGAPVAGLPVTLQAMPKGSKSWNDVATDTTGARGVTRFAVSPARNTVYRVQSGYNPTWEMTSSASRQLFVAVKLSTKVNSRTVYGMTTTWVGKYERTRIAGSVSPNKAGRVIKLKKYRDGRWRTIREKRLSDNSNFVFRFRPHRSGTHRLQVVKPDDYRNAGSRRVIRLTVG